MTPQEQTLLEGLIQRVQQTHLATKDQQAEQMLRQSLSQNPDSLYILSQTVIVQQYALDQAQKQLADLRQQVQQARPDPALQAPQHTSFLGSIFGSGSAQPPRPPAPPPPVPQQYAPVAYQPVQQQYAPQSSGGLFGGGGGGGGFLQGAMQTAAGVAAGALAFQGIEDLMHGFGHSAGYGSDRGLMGDSGDRPEVVNNYYGDNRGSQEGFGDRLESADAGDGSNADVEDRRGGSQGFLDTSDNDTASNDVTDSSDDFSGTDDSTDFGSSDNN